MDQRLHSLVPVEALIDDLQRHLGTVYPPQVSFLAAGEYSLNFLVDYEGRQSVARCVTGSQMELSPTDQITYEAHALELLAESGRTPHFFSFEVEPRQVVYPFMILEYLPGKPLNYGVDLEEAARCMAAIHQLRAPEDHRLVVHDDPAPPLLDEAWLLAKPYLDWDDAPPGSGEALRKLFDAVESGLSDEDDPFVGTNLSIVNTDLNSHNFVVHEGRVSLLDWERARFGPAVQDLAHFLIPTTTLWRDDTSARLSEADEDLFVNVYLSERLDLDRELFVAQLREMKRLATLRAVSWCAWLIQATATGKRPISNPETLANSQMFLEPEFLRELAYLRT